MARYADLDAEADRMLGTGAPDAPPPPAAIPTAVHEQTLDLLDELLGRLDRSTTSAPRFAPMLRAMHAMRNRLLRDFAQVPPDEIRAFAHELGRKLLAIGADPALEAPKE